MSDREQTTAPVTDADLENERFICRACSAFYPAQGENCPSCGKDEWVKNPNYDELVRRHLAQTIRPIDSAKDVSLPHMPSPCTVATTVAAEVMRRSEFGRSKYGATLDRAGLSPLELLQHAKEEAMDLACYLQTLLSKTAEPDKGPWKVAHSGDEAVEGVWIESADFRHDVRLYVNGDFETLDQRINYAERIARKLNAAGIPSEQ